MGYVMPYLLLPDEEFDRPEFVALPPLAQLLHIAGKSYCARMLTDGYVPKVQVRKLTTIEEVTPLLTALLTAGLWRDEGDYWYLADFLDHNRTREQVLRERAKGAERQARWRGVHPGARWQPLSNGVTNAPSNGSRNADVTPPDNGVTNAVQSGPIPTTPSPTEMGGPDADAPEPAPAPKRKRAPKAEPAGELVEKHPAVNLYRKLTNIGPRPAVRDLIDRSVPGDAAALAKWEAAVTTWMARSKPPMHVEGMLEWFREGIPDPPVRGGAPVGPAGGAPGGANGLPKGHYGPDGSYTPPVAFQRNPGPEPVARKALTPEEEARQREAVEEARRRLATKGLAGRVSPEEVEAKLRPGGRPT